MELGFGLITCQRYPGDPRTAADLYREALELAKASEAAGLDSVWTSEHHFWDDEYMPSLLVLSSAFGAVTSRIKIGTGVLLAPLYHPIRLAEDAATVDLISGGRLILGLGLGWRAEEFERLGVPMQGLGKRMSHTIKVLRGAWGREPFTYEGSPLNVTPKPSQSIPIWVGGTADPALRRAGRLGDAYFGSMVPLDDVARRKSVVEAAIQKAGRDPSKFTWALHEPVWATDDPEKDLDRVLPHIHYSRWKYADVAQAFGRSSSGLLPEPPPVDDQIRESLTRHLIIGTPEEVAKKIAEFREILGPDMHLVARSDYPGLSLDSLLQCITKLGEVRKILG